jgi:hypothetical protein
MTGQAQGGISGNGAKEQSYIVDEKKERGLRMFSLCSSALRDIDIMQQHCRRERDIVDMIHHPYLVCWTPSPGEPWRSIMHLRDPLAVKEGLAYPPLTIHRSRSPAPRGRDRFISFSLGVRACVCVAVTVVP